MKKLLILIVILIAAFLIYKFVFKKEDIAKTEPKSLTVGTHSEEFNKSVEDFISSYYSMTDGFVNWDSSAVNKNANQLQTALGNFKIDELKPDTVIYETAVFPLDNAKGNVSSILSSAGWEDKRHALNDLSDNLRMLLLAVKYNKKDTIYWQECPMAFGENTTGNWLSASSEVVNPYLGKKDPKYGATMLNCGETKQKINFAADSTK